MKIEFPNIGLITRKIPDELFSLLKEEAELAKKARYGDSKRPEMTSGLTSPGVPIHYYIQECKDQFTAFIIDMYEEFIHENPNYLSKFKFATKSMGSVASPPWINIQERGEYIPNHTHDGVVSYAGWINIPYDIGEETHNNPQSVTSCLQFLYKDLIGTDCSQEFALTKQDEGNIIMFPSALKHCVYPFYTSDDVRISLSGCISLDTDNVIN